MRNLADPRLQSMRIKDPRGDVPDELRAWGGCFLVSITSGVALGNRLFDKKTVHLRVIASRGGGPAELGGDDPTARWDHVSVSLEDRTPTWGEMCFVKEIFFERDEPAMQLHPHRDYINNHPYCLHLWRPLDAEIPLPPSILVGLPQLNLKGTRP